MAKCSIEGCPNESGLPGSARGWCRAHYRRWQRYGDVEAPLRKIQSWNGEVCTEPGCANHARANGMCSTHYARTRRHGDVEGNRRRSLEFKARYRARQEAEMGRPRPIVCELCGETGRGRGNKPHAGICFDHDHETGKPRGWLCDRCNKVLGLVRDDIGLLTNMTLYLIHGGTNGTPVGIAA